MDNRVHQSNTMPKTESDEISLKEMARHQQQQKQNTSDSLSIALPPSDPTGTSAETSGNSPASPPGYYFPNSPREIFLKHPPPQLGEKEIKQIMKEAEKKDLEELDEESGKQNEENEEAEAQENRLAALNRRQTRLYRTLVWAQFSMTVFTCIFIMVIMILVAVILVMLQRTIDRADHAIRDNPVSQIYSKLKNAVNKINI